ncbi:hypothetical protein RXV94_00170 [Yeosuana sp. MJ-SS3]|jgi:hypothetical protein|uniref:Uncharacterized protein n=1 Tax=Gilvirhabdus luticola TaxID=3079858 RepID=A0ABU3U2E5_9FLAO|nr:hypothetical protein [Yeosuana sp. MJ-SS3]MDU8884553.1 hypothetical protein [Yeosuana sp. MJ-SS3]
MKFKEVIWIMPVGLVIGLILYSFGDKINILKVKPFSKYLFWIVWPSVIFLSSFLYDLIIKKYSIITAILMIFGVMLGVIINIVLDININSTSHSLAGIEVIVISCITGPSVILGIGLSQLILFFRRRLKGSTK